MPVNDPSSVAGSFGRESTAREVFSRGREKRKDFISAKDSQRRPRSRMDSGIRANAVAAEVTSGLGLMAKSALSPRRLLLLESAAAALSKIDK